jgi:uncharacterized membrane protein
MKMIVCQIFNLLHIYHIFLEKTLYKNENSQIFHMIQTIQNHMVQSIFNFNKS